jgi:glycosyltransferase involved in cell wall biosynthesis
MAEVTTTLSPALPEHLRHLMAFDVGPRAVDEIAAKLVEWLELDPAEREKARAALAAEAARRYSWESVAEGVIQAASGHPSAPR